MRSNTNRFLINLLGPAAMIAATLATVLIEAPRRSDKVAVLFPPWWSAAHAFEAAGTAGRIMALGRLPSLMIVHGDPSVLSARLHAAGALLVLDSSRLAGCRAARSELSL